MEARPKTPSRKSPRCLTYYPWDLGRPSGSQSVLLDYTRALREAGFLVDCFAPVWTRSSESLGRLEHTFDRIFTPPFVPDVLQAAFKAALDALPPPGPWLDPGYDPGALAAAGLLVAAGDYDLLAVHYTRCAAIRRLAPEIPAILFTHDLDSIVAIQEGTIFGTSPERTLADEATAMSDFDAVTVLGPTDAQLLRSVSDGLPVIEAPYCVTPCPATHRAIGSPASLLWLSNDAPFHELSFQWFWEHVWPLLGADNLDVRLVIAGKITESARLLGAGQDARVQLAGVVSDPTALYTSADVFLAPYYYGGGLKTKILDSLAQGLPTVTTSYGLTNTRLTPSVDVMVADTAAEYALAIGALVRNPELRRHLVDQATGYLKEWHDSARSHAELRTFLEHLIARRTLGSQKPNSAFCPQQPYVDKLLGYLVPWTVDRCRRDGVKSVYVYGAGRHTQALVPLWRKAGGPRIDGFVVSNLSAPEIFMDLPVVAAAEFDPQATDGLVVSSMAFERDLAAAGRQRWPDLPIYAVWRPLPWVAGSRPSVSPDIPLGSLH